MDWLLLGKAAILGILEGLTEFLPVSSTGHLIVVGDLLNFTGDQAKTFEIVIQLGAILAIVWHYRHKVLTVIRGLGREASANKFAANLLIAFLPAAVLGLLFHHAIKEKLFNPITVAIALVVGGILILVIERLKPEPRIHQVDDLSWKDALKLGFAQSLALFPGVSRSGATIMGGLMFGLSRTAATEFSFFIAIPTMFAATGYDLLKNMSALHSADFGYFAIGFVCAFISASAVVKTLLHYVAKHDFSLFAYYRILFGGIVLWWHFHG